MASSTVYRDLLLHKRHGLPFWTPEPDANLPEAYRDRGISIGDLGLLTDDGGFDYLFNIHATADDPVNHLGTPTDFNPLQKPECGIRKIESFHSERSCITRNIATRLANTIGAGADVMPASVGLEVEFTVTEERAAMLVLPHGADRYEAKTYQIYVEHAIQHGEAWYRFVNQIQRRGARNDSLYLVTGCDKGRSWGLAAGSQLQEHTVGFKFTGGSLAQGTVGFHASWTTADGLESRKYPRSIMDTTARVNQCVFARGLVIGINENILKRAFSGTVRRKQIGSSRSNPFPAVGNSVPFGSPPGNSELPSSAPQSPPPRDPANESSFGDLSHRQLDATDVGDSDNTSSLIVQVFPQYPKQVLSPGSYICEYLLSSRPDINVVVVHDNVWIEVASSTAENIFTSDGTDYQRLTTHVLEKCQLQVAQGTVMLISSLQNESPGTHPHQGTVRPISAMPDAVALLNDIDSDSDSDSGVRTATVSGDHDFSKQSQLVELAEHVPQKNAQDEHDHRSALTGSSRMNTPSIVQNVNIVKYRSDSCRSPSPSSAVDLHRAKAREQGAPLSTIENNRSSFPGTSRMGSARPNIIVFGQTGAGKSSLINMLAGELRAKESNGATGCTSSNNSIEISRGWPDGTQTTYTFWDTPGLGEGALGNIPARAAVTNLSDLFREHSVDLIIYCVRGSKPTDVVRVNYDLVSGIVREKKVPIILVVTGLEQEENMDDWWKRNKESIKKMGLASAFDGYACVTTTKGRNGIHWIEYEESANKVWMLVKKFCHPTTTLEPQRMANSKRHNVIIFGESGSGKSSIVNMIVGGNVAIVSDSPVGCTFQSDRYEAHIGNDDYYIYDTVGLNEGDQGRVPHWTAIQELYTLIRELDSVSLLLYCIRGRIKENTAANWTLFKDIICAGEVPAVIVETGLEHNLQGEARRPVLETALQMYGISPMDLICIVSIQGKNGEYEGVYEWSQQQLRKLVERSHRREPWSKEKDVWLSSIYEEVYTTGNFFLRRRRLEFAGTVRAAINEFIKASDMNAEDSKRLEESLLSAEKKFRKRFKHRRPKV